MFSKIHSQMKKFDESEISYEQFVNYGKKVKLLAKLISNESQKTLSRRFLTSRVEILPGIYSDDARLPLFLERLARELSEKFPKSDIDESGAFVGAPIATDFSEIKTLAGSVRQPLNFGNGKASTDVSVSELEEVFTELRYLFSSTKLSNSKAKIKVKTNVGAPYWDHNQARTLKHLDLLSAHINEIVKLTLRFEFKELFQKYRLLFLNHTQIRLQNDKWIDGQPKSRPIYSFSDSFNKTDSITTSSVMSNRLATCRTRTVTAGPKAINLIISAVMEPIRKGFESRFANTWKRNDLASQSEHVKSFKYFIGLDIKSYDQNLPLSLVEGVLSTFPITDEFKQFILITLLMPLYCSDVDGEGTVMASSDPLNDTRLVWRGLNSGHALTSAFGKYPVMVVLYYLFKKNGFLAGKTFEDFLSWKTDICVSNMSDDNKIYTNNPDVIQFIKRTNLKNPWLNFEIEEGISFVGLLTYYDPTDKQFKVTYNLSSYVSKMFCPEKSISSKIKPYGVYGRLEAMKTSMYGHHPLFSQLNAVVREVFTSHFGVDLVDLLRRHVTMPPVSVFNTASIEVILDPDKIEYKYDVDEIDKVIVDEIVSEIPDYIIDRFSQFRLVI